MIIYNKMISAMKTQGVTAYRLVKGDKIIGGSTWDVIRTNSGHISTKAINDICEYLNCQPGDLMEYIPDE